MRAGVGAVDFFHIVDGWTQGRVMLGKASSLIIEWQVPKRNTLMGG